MKITKSQLKQIIQEELKSVFEADLDGDGSLNADELRDMANKLDTEDDPVPEIPELKNIKIHSSGEHASMMIPGLRGRSKEDVKNYLMDLGIFPDKIGDGVVAFARKKRYLASFEGFFEELQEYDENWSEHLSTGRSFDLDRNEPGEKYPLLEKNMKIKKIQLTRIILEELNAVLSEQEFHEIDAKDVNEEYCPVCRESQELEERRKKRKKKRKKACKPSKGKRFAKRVNGKCRSFGQKGQAKGGGDRIRPGTKKGDAYCARSAGIKKCKNPPCANTLSRKKWKCRGKKSVAE